MRNRKRGKRIKEIRKKVIKIEKKAPKNQSNGGDSLDKIFSKVDVLPTPFEIAKLYGLKILYEDLDGDVPSSLDLKNFKIRISKKYKDDEYVARHLCAHELGHFFLHNKSAEMNNFPSKEIEEYEANVFSILLMPQIMGGYEWENMEPKDLNKMIYEKILKRNK